MEFLAWLEQTDASVWLRESDWGHPIILCFHAVGMGMVVGIRQAVRLGVVRICHERRFRRPSVLRRATTADGHAGILDQDDPDRVCRPCALGARQGTARRFSRRNWSRNAAWPNG